MNPFIGGNHIQLLCNGAEYFPALEAAIELATHEIYLQTYIYESDKIGLRIGNALKHAAQRGVIVNILLDGFGSKDLPAAFVKELEAAGVNVMFYRPKISPWTLKKSRLRRMHRKVSVIDGKVGFVGGINIIDDYNVPDNMPPQLTDTVQYCRQQFAFHTHRIINAWWHVVRYIVVINNVNTTNKANSAINHCYFAMHAT